MSKPNWDEYFMDLAYTTSTRSTCPRRNVGAVLTKKRRLMKTGYNGAPSGVTECAEAGCLMKRTQEIEDGEWVEKEHCVRTTHAEQNVLIFSSPEELNNATLYVTDQPCWTCAMQIINAGIAEVVFHREYKKQFRAVVDLLTEAGIFVRQLYEYEIPANIIHRSVTE